MPLRELMKLNGELSTSRIRERGCSEILPVLINYPTQVLDVDVVANFRAVLPVQPDSKVVVIRVHQLQHFIGIVAIACSENAHLELTAFFEPTQHFVEVWPQRHKHGLLWGTLLNHRECLLTEFHFVVMEGITRVLRMAQRFVEVKQ